MWAKPSYTLENQRWKKTRTRDPNHYQEGETDSSWRKKVNLLGHEQMITVGLDDLNRSFPRGPKWICETQAIGVRSSGAAYLSQQKEVLRENDWAESMSLTDTCTVGTKWGGDVVECWEGIGFPTPSMILIQRCHGGCWSYMVCHDCLPLEHDIFENLSCVLSSERRVGHVMQLDLHLA